MILSKKRGPNGGAIAALANVRQADLIAFNDSERLPQDMGGELRLGQTYLANESRFESSHHSEEITDYLVGWLDGEDLMGSLEAIAPAVDAPRKFSFELMDNADGFMSEVDDVRAIGADFKRVDSKGQIQTERTYNKGLTRRIDKDDIGAGGKDQKIRLTTRILTDRLFRNDLRRATTLYQTASNTNKTWDESANPDQDLLTLIQSSGDASGINPNVLVMDSGVWLLRYGSLTNAARSFSSPNAGFSKEQLASFLGIDQVVQLNERYQTKKTATTKTKVMTSNTVVSATINPITDEQADGTNIKRFVSDVDGGGRFRVLVNETDKFITVTVEHYSNLIKVSSLGLEKYTVSAS